jgi:methylated-DNA-protein-cysteine methyltransferase-like protein
LTPELTAAVYQIARLVPPGRATTYGAVARAIGLPRGARAVGRAMSLCPSAEPGRPEYGPAHRVVGAGGLLTAAAAFGPPGVMRGRLQAEGIEVRPSDTGTDRIRGWKKVFWDPFDGI